MHPIFSSYVCKFAHPVVSLCCKAYLSPFLVLMTRPVSVRRRRDFFYPFFLLRRLVCPFSAHAMETNPPSP